MFAEKIELKSLLGILLLLGSTSIGLQISLEAENTIIENTTDSEDLLAESVELTEEYIPLMESHQTQWDSYKAKNGRILEYSLTSAQKSEEYLEVAAIAEDDDSEILLSSHPNIDLAISLNTKQQHFTLTFLAL